MTTVLQHEQAKTEDLPVTMRTERKEASEALAADVEAFFAKGGKKKVIPYGVSKDSKPDPAKGTDSIGREKGEWHKGAKRYATAAKEKNGQLERKKSGWRDIQDRRSASADEQGNW